MSENPKCDFYCPKCKEKASTTNSYFVTSYSMSGLTLKIFLCSACRTIYIDKPTVRRMISNWRKEKMFRKKIPFRQLYAEFLGELEDLVENHFIPNLGYKKVRFLKHP